MNVSRQTDPVPQPYTPTPDGSERRLLAWTRLPIDGMSMPAAKDANSPPQEPSARDHA
jgi:hypothetical protein